LATSITAGPINIGASSTSKEQPDDCGVRLGGDLATAGGEGRGEAERPLDSLNIQCEKENLHFANEKELY